VCGKFRGEDLGSTSSKCEGNTCHNRQKRREIVTTVKSKTSGLTIKGIGIRQKRVGLIFYPVCLVRLIRGLHHLGKRRGPAARQKGPQLKAE